MTTFADLGLREELTRAASTVGYERPTALQAAAIPVLRRGGNVLLAGSSGAGVTAAWGLSLMDRLLEEEAEAPEEAGQWPRVVAITPTAERAAQMADGLAALAAGSGLTVRAALPGWGRDAAPDILVMPAASVLRSLERSTLKLGRTIAVVLDAADALITLHGTEPLEPLMVAADRKVQRIVVASKATPAVEQLITSHVRRAVTIPPPSTAVPPEPTGSVAYVVAHESAKEEEAARLLAARGENPGTVGTRSGMRATAVAERLAVRGIVARVIPLEDASVKSVSVAYDVPPDAELMASLEPDAVVLVEPDEVAHLRAIAAEAGLGAHASPERVAKGPIERFRDEVRRALDGEDIEAQLLVLEPLFATRPAEEVAAALSALLRAKIDAAAVTAPVVSSTQRAVPRSAPVGEAPETFVRLFVGAGERDNLRPGDLVGAITGEAGVSGDQIGRVEIRDVFSVVEVHPEIAERVIRALNGTTLRGRSLRVDYDRKGATSAPARGREERGRSDRPPGDRPRSDRPGGDRPKGGRPGGDRPRSDRPKSDRPGGDRPKGGRPGGDRPKGGRPGGRPRR